MSTRVTAASGATPRQRTRRIIGNTNRQAVDEETRMTKMVPRPPLPRNYMAIGDESMPMMQDERRTADLMHKPNGGPNVHNATPRIIKKEPRVSKAEPMASTAKAPTPSGEPVEFDPAFGLRAQMQPYDASGDSGLSPHAEYSLEILREFFQRRPIQALKDTFFMMDTNCSGDPNPNPNPNSNPDT